MGALTFGILHDFRQPLPHLAGVDEYYGECLDEVAEADELGFDAVWMSEHHLTGDGLLPAPLVMAAAIAARTRRIRIGTNIVPLPLHHPIRVAEDAAVADLVSAGRLVLGVGQGYAENEFAVFGADRRRRGELLEEGIEILRRAWTGAAFSFEGRHWRFDQVRVTPSPRGRLPIYVGAVSEPALRRAERLADGLLIYCGKISDLRERFALLDRLGIELPLTVTGIMHVAGSADHAWAEAATGIRYLEGEIAKYGQRDLAHDLRADDYLVGTPDQVAAKLADLYRTRPFDHFAHWARLPGISHQRCVETLHLVTREVLPRVRELLDSPPVHEAKSARGARLRG